MASHNSATKDFFGSHEIADPGDAKTIVVDRTPAIVYVVTAGAETRTLGRPTRTGAVVTLYGRTLVGTATVTITGGFNSDGDTTFALTTAAQFVKFESHETSTSGTFVWRKVADYGLGNIAPDDAAVLDELSALTATAAEINSVAKLSTRPIPLTPTASQTITLTAATYSDRVILITTDTISFTINLPAMAGSGAKFKIAMGKTLSSATMTVTATGAHIFGGIPMNTDTGAGTLFTCVAAANAGGSTNIALNGAANGGRKGDWIEIFDAAASIGLVSGMLNGSGTESTPFS